MRKIGVRAVPSRCRELYGGEPEWAREALRRLEAWGFNTLGANHTPSLRHRGLANTEFLGLGGGFIQHSAIAPRNAGYNGPPNVFDPDFPAYCDSEARRRCAPLRNDPWLLGYFLDNALPGSATPGTPPSATPPCNCLREIPLARPRTGLLSRIRPARR